MFACEYNRNAPLDLMADNGIELALDIRTMRAFLGVFVGVGVWGEEWREGATLLCFAVERSKQCLKRQASSGKKKKAERMIAGQPNANYIKENCK